MIDPETNRFVDRRKCITSMTEDEINMIAERAAERAVDKITAQIYQQVGRTVMEKLLWAIGLITVGMFFWLQHKGIISTK